MKPNIALIGMMGAGKTTIGCLLSQALKMGFFDIDAEIEMSQNMGISDIFASYDEAFFRALENEICKKIPQTSGVVVSTGGGIVLNAENVALLQQSCVIIYLSATPKTLRTRIMSEQCSSQQQGRPLLLHHSIDDILAARRHLYEAAADHIVITDNKSLREACAEILELLA